MCVMCCGADGCVGTPTQIWIMLDKSLTADAEERLRSDIVQVFCTRMHVYVYVCVCVCVCACTYVRMHVYVCLCLYASVV